MTWVRLWVIGEVPVATSLGFDALGMNCDLMCTTFPCTKLAIAFGGLLVALSRVADVFERGMGACPLARFARLQVQFSLPRSDPFPQK